jgi:hypothetical protein
VLRAFIGPLDRPLQVRAPLNAEGFFGLVLIVLLLAPRAACAPGEPRQRLSKWRGAVLLLVVTVVIVFAFRRTLHLSLLSDDFIHVKQARAFQFSLGQLFAIGGGDGSFRPIGALSVALTYQWAGASPERWHAFALAMHTVNSFLVFVLASQSSRCPLAAFFAATLFAIHGTRPEVAVWIAGRFDLLATFFVLSGLALFVRSTSRPGSTAFGYQIAAVVSMVLAILSKESAYAFPFLVLMLAFSGKCQLASPIRTLVPFFVVATMLLLHRWILFGDIGGYRDAQSGRPQVLTLGFVHSTKALFMRLWAVLYFPVNWSAEPDALLACLLGAYVICLCWLAVACTRTPERTPDLLLGVGFVLLSALPPLHLLLIGPGLENSRILYLPAVGFCLMLSAAIDSVQSRVRHVIAAVVLVFHLAVLNHNLKSWEYASVNAQDVVLAAVRCITTGTDAIVVSGVPSAVRGVPFFANGLAQAIELQRGGAPVMVIRTADHRPGSPSLVWDATTERVRCVGPEGLPED